MAIKFLNTVDTDVAFVSKGGSYSATNETKTDVAISVLQNNKIYSETSSGYLRNLMYHDSNGSIQIGQDGTALITDIIMKPGTSGNVIFRTQSNSETARISSNGNVGIGTTSPDNTLDVVASDVNITPNAESSAVFRRNGNNYLTILSNASNEGGILFGNAVDANDGTISYKHNTQSMQFSTADAERMRITSAGNVGIGVTGPSEKLEVAGNIKITSALLSNQENTDIDTGAEVVAQVAIATYTAAFFDFVVKKTTNVRSGTVYACHDGTNVEFTETSTQDLGNTSDVTLSVDISGGNMRLLATVTSDDWSVKSLIRAI